MLQANALLATLTVFAFIKQSMHVPKKRLKGTWGHSHVTDDVIALSQLK